MKEKKIVLVANYLPDRQESMLRFADMLKAGFQEAGYKVIVLHPIAIFGVISKTTSFGLGKWLGYIDKWLLFPLILKLRTTAALDGHGAHYHVCDHSNAPYLNVLPAKGTSITCHDVLAIRGAFGYSDAHCKTSRTGVFLQQWILKNLVKAKQLAAVSNLTLHQLAELTSIPEKKRHNWQVIHNAFNAPYTRMEKVRATIILEKHGLEQGIPFILHVGSSLPRKNRKMLIQMISKLENKWNGHICFAGEALDPDLLSLATEMGLIEKIKSVVKPNHETLVALYSSCEAFIFPSFSEGFGWPLIEAQACGAPVIASNIDPMSEVSGGAAIHVNPYDPQSFSNALLALQNPQFRKNMVEQGYQNTKRFSTERMIQSYLLMFGLDSSNSNHNAH